METLVSVIVPNYNHADFLEQRIQSILTQTHQNVELIILDDGSTDNSRNFLESFRNHPKVKALLFNEKNSGGSSYKQWQKGFARCTGEWVWVAESDDWCEPSFLQALLEKVTGQCNLAFVQSMVVQNNGILWNSSRSVLYETIPAQRFIQEEMIAGNAVFNASMAIFRRSALEAVKFDFSQFAFLGDWAFWSAIAASGDVLICGKVLNYFKQNSSGVSAGAKKAGGLYREYPKLLDLMVGQGWISAAQRQPALNAMFQRFLADEHIDKNDKQILEGQYKTLVAVPFLKRLWRWQKIKRSVAQGITG